MVAKTLVWYPFFKPWKPRLVAGQRVVFPQGDYSIPTNFRELVHWVEKMPEHKFILLNEDPEIFYSLPANGIPVLHVSSKEELKRNEERFLETVGDHPLKGLSMFCGKESIWTDNQWDIVIVKGYSFVHMDNTIKALRNKNNPVYVDSFKKMGQLGKLPDRFRIRQLEGVLK